MDSGSSQRLDSWKAIAEYLDRDVATVRRWEKSASLPVRRVPGGRGSSVFAYRSEIDEWLRHGGTAESSVAPLPPALAAPEPPVDGGGRRRFWMAALATITMGIAVIAWHGRGPAMDGSELAVAVTPTAVIARLADGAERWRHALPAGQRAVLTLRPDSQAILVNRGRRGVIAGTSYSINAANTTVHAGGQLLWLSPAGRLERAFSFTESLTFNGAPYAPPWGITDYRLNEDAGAHQLAVAAHHMQWWPSIVTVLNGRWERAATFVNAGWVEHLQWLSPDRLLVVGFSNARDGGMLALLDPQTMNGQAPLTGDPTYVCDDCGPESPERYVVMPRSELNRVTASRFNRAVVERPGDRLVVNTIEVPRETEPPAAVYEFSPALEIQSAAYNDRYWELHRSLEAQGTLDHPRERCPERNGPPLIEVWERGRGWKSVHLRKEPNPAP